MVASFVSSVLGSLLGGSSAERSLQDSLALQTHQYKLNRKTRQTAFQDTRKSLEEADYNPLLAVGQQAQGGTFGASLSQTSPGTEALQNYIALGQLNSQQKLNSAQAYNQYKQGQLTTAQANNLISQSHLNSAQQTLTNLQSNAQAITNLHLPQTLKSQIRLNNNTAQAQLINAQANQTSALANQMNAYSNRMNAYTNRSVGASQVYRNNNASLGYTTSGSIGPIHFSHTGNPNVYTQGTKGSPAKYQTEYINGKPIKVLVIR